VLPITVVYVHIEEFLQLGVSEWQSRKREGGRRRWKKSIHMYIYALPLDYIYKVYTYSSTYRNKVEHSCSSIGEKEGRRR
jgi:hypothetical protein